MQVSSGIVQSVNGYVREFFNMPLTCYYTSTSHRLAIALLYAFSAGLLSFAAFQYYLWLRPTYNIPLAFQGVYAWETALNFGCWMMVCDAIVVLLKRKWFPGFQVTQARLLGIWLGAFVLAFIVQRTIIFYTIEAYHPELAALFERSPESRPTHVESFLFCFPFWLVLSLTLLIIVKHHQDKATVRDGSDSRPLETPDRPLKQDRLVSMQTVAGIERFDPSRITHITVEDHYSRIFLKDASSHREIFVKQSLKHLKVHLAHERLLQIHRSHLVNIDFVQSIKKNQRSYRVIVDCGAFELPLSRHRLGDVLPRLETLPLPTLPHTHSRTP